MSKYCNCFFKSTQISMIWDFQFTAWLSNIFLSQYCFIIWSQYCFIIWSQYCRWKLLVWCKPKIVFPYFRLKWKWDKGLRKMLVKLTNEEFVKCIFPLDESWLWSKSLFFLERQWEGKKYWIMILNPRFASKELTKSKKVRNRLKQGF